MKLRIILIAALGLALALYLFAHVGFAAVLSAAVAVGWGGFFLLCALSLATLPLLGSAWYSLLPAALGRRFWVLLWARCVRDAAAEVLPFSPLGGMVIGARAALLHGVARRVAYGSLIVDVTTEMLGQIAYVAIGLEIFALHAPRSAVSPALRTALAVGMLLLVLGGVIFVTLQRRGHRLVARLAARLLPQTAAATESIGAMLDTIYASPLRVAASAMLHLCAWIASAVGSWIALELIGVRIDLASVIAIESLICAVRSAALVIPSGLGVQEATYSVLMPLFGVPAPFGLALSLLKRARDVTVGVPPLLAWQAVESRRVLSAQAPEAVQEPL